MDPLIDLQNMPPEPKLWDSLEKERLDREYNNNDNIQPFDQQKQQLLKELYWENPSVTIVDNIENSWNKVSDSKEKPKKLERISEKDFEKFSEHPSFPILERLWKSVKEKTGSALSIEDFTKIYENIKWKESSWNILEDVINALKETKLDIREDGINIWDLMLEELAEIKKQNENSGYWKEEKTQEKKWKIKLPETFSQYEFLKDENSLTVKLLAANYLDFPAWANWEKNTEKDLETAFNITVNKIIDRKNIPRTESFEIALKDVRSWDIETKFYALQYINSFVQVKEWWKWKKADMSFKKINNEHNQRKQVYIDFKIKQIETLIKTTTENDKKTQLIEELKKYNEEKEVDDLEWEVFESWKIDKFNEDEWPISEEK